MRYCTKHQRAWLHPSSLPSLHARGAWHALRRGNLALAVGLSHTPGYPHPITLDYVDCDQCDATQPHPMSMDAFLAALPPLAALYHWYEDEHGQLRATIAGIQGGTHSTITALAEVRTSTQYDLNMSWEDAARALGLALEDASAITSAEDQDLRHDGRLAQRLRRAVGLRTCEEDEP